MTAESTVTVTPVLAKYPLAHESGIRLLAQVLAASQVWRGLTRPQRELLLSTVAGYPIAARRDVKQRLTDKGLISPCWRLHDHHIEPTELGRAVVQWRTLP